MCAPENLYIPIATNLLNYPARNVFAPETTPTRKFRRDNSDETIRPIHPTFRRYGTFLTQ